MNNKRKKKRMHTDFWRDLHGEAAVGDFLLSNLWSQLGNSTC